MDKLNRLTRRDLLKSSAFVTASALAAPSLLADEASYQAAKPTNSLSADPFSLQYRSDVDIAGT